MFGHERFLTLWKITLRKRCKLQCKGTLQERPTSAPSSRSATPRHDPRPAVTYATSTAVRLRTQFPPHHNRKYFVLCGDGRFGEHGRPHVSGTVPTPAQAISCAAGKAQPSVRRTEKR